MTPAETDRCCSFCGLPLPAGFTVGARSGNHAPTDEQREAVFCCFGCRFAAAVTKSGGEEGAAGWMLARLGLAVFLTMNVMVFTMALWTQDFYAEAAAEPAPAGVLRGLFRHLSLLFALPVLLLLGGPLWENAWRDLRRGRPNADLLLVVGVIASYLYSAVSVVRDRGAVYFEVGCLVLVLVTLGRWLEATGKLRTTAAIEGLQRLLPEQARVVAGGDESCVPLAEVDVGACLRVLPGERVPCDGRVQHNPATVDEQILTGESRAVPKGPGDPVFGGTLNLDGDLYLTVTAPASGGTLARMAELVRRARLTKGRHERLADRVSAWFLPAVLLVAAGAGAWHAARHGAEHGLLTALAVLLIACPCALGLATPMAVWAALGRAAQNGVLFRNGEAIERLAGVRAFYFDKTGTLTTGEPSVAEFAAAPGAEGAEVLGLAAFIGSSSTHGYSLAIRRFAADSQSPPSAAFGGEGSWVRTLPGQGLIARLPGHSSDVVLGSPQLMRQRNLSWDANLAALRDNALASGESLSCIGRAGAVRGVFVFRERLRPGAAGALAQLREKGYAVAVLTGDNTSRGEAISRELGVRVCAELFPEAKVAVVEEARRTLGPVAMVGDGINDAPALAASDAGIALDCGADVSRDSALVCLSGDDLARVPWAAGLARQTVRVVRQNLFWAFAYNAAGIGLACTGRLNPVLAALAMALSSFLVVANSLRLSGPAQSDQRDGPAGEALAPRLGGQGS
jgi:heavy metal translocating P-type ATPase